jgi:hypothetical protein
MSAESQNCESSKKQPLLGKGFVTRNNGGTVESDVLYAVRADSNVRQQ